MNTYSKKSGFTLVELAIVIVIIGLLVGGVLQGQELIKQAKNRNYIKRLQEIQAAATTFYGKYNCIPGDCINAANFGLTYNGDGDGKLGYAKGAQYFWAHLSLAKMLNVVKEDNTAFSSTNFGRWSRFINDRGSTTGYAYASYGDIYSGADPDFPHPEAPIAVYTVGNYVTISSLISGGFQGAAAFTADDTRIIDEKIDDGSPKNGKFIGADARLQSNYSTITRCSNSGVYANDSNNLLCRIMYDLGI